MHRRLVVYQHDLCGFNLIIAGYCHYCHQYAFRLSVLAVAIVKMRVKDECQRTDEPGVARTCTRQVAQIERMAGYLQQHLEHACRRLPSRQAANSTATLDASFAVVKRQSRELAKEVQCARRCQQRRACNRVSQAGRHRDACIGR